MKRYPFELDAFEVGVITGMLWQFDKKDPVRIHFEHRLLPVINQIYEDSAEANIAEASALVSALGNP